MISRLNLIKTQFLILSLDSAQKKNNNHWYFGSINYANLLRRKKIHFEYSMLFLWRIYGMSYFIDKISLFIDIFGINLECTL